MTQFRYPNEFPKSGFFLVYENVSETLKEFSIFEVDGNWVQCYDTVITSYLDDVDLGHSDVANDTWLARYALEFYLDIFYHTGNLHYKLTDNEVLNHVIIKSL